MFSKQHTKQSPITPEETAQKHSLKFSEKNVANDRTLHDIYICITNCNQLTKLQYVLWCKLSDNHNQSIHYFPLMEHLQWKAPKERKTILTHSSSSFYKTPVAPLASSWNGTYWKIIKLCTFYPTCFTHGFHNATWHLFHIKHLIYFLSWSTGITEWTVPRCRISVTECNVKSELLHWLGTENPHLTTRGGLWGDTASIGEINGPANDTCRKPRLHLSLMLGKVGSGQTISSLG